MTIIVCKLNNIGFSLVLTFCVVYAVHGVFYILTEQSLKFFFYHLESTFRGCEAGLFYAF